MKPRFLAISNNRRLLVAVLVLAISYTVSLFLLFRPADKFLFGLLALSQVFYFWQIISFIYSLWNIQVPKIVKVLPGEELSVDIFITVAGEPLEIIKQTVQGALSQRYLNFNVYILNDGYVAKKENWQEVENLANRLGITCITRKISGHAKAGNINHALKQTNSDLVVVFDADHVPRPDFLQKTVGYFTDPALAFVQTPQFYKNWLHNRTTVAAWQQQSLFFGPICLGKNRLFCVTMSGTNMVIRRSALERVGGIATESIAEDLLTGLRLHNLGYRSLYIPEVLAAGLAPFDLPAYASQQFRWARGSLEVLIKHNPLFMRGLTAGQKFSYLASLSYFLSGSIVLASALLPLLFFFTGRVPVTVSGMVLAAVFLPYITLVVLMLGHFSRGTFNYRAVAFSLGSFWIQIKALLATVFGIRNGFVITPKNHKQNLELKKALSLCWPHLVFLFAGFLGVGVALRREGLTSALVNNLAWFVWYASVFWPYVAESFAYQPKAATMENKAAVPHTAYAR